MGEVGVKLFQNIGLQIECMSEIPIYKLLLWIKKGNCELGHLLFDLNLDERLWNLSRFSVHVWKSEPVIENLNLQLY